MIRICNKYIVLLGILMSLFIGSLALAADPLKIYINLQNATCKAGAPDPDMVQCSGITANWTDPQTNNPVFWAGDVNFVWDPSNYIFRIQNGFEKVDCDNTVRVQVADIKGDPLPNVTVSVTPKGSMSWGSKSSTTDDDGIARFQGVPKGTADISVPAGTADRYQPQTLTVPVGCGLIPVAVRLMPK